MLVNLYQMFSLVDKDCQYPWRDERSASSELSMSSRSEWVIRRNGWDRCEETI